MVWEGDCPTGAFTELVLGCVLGVGGSALLVFLICRAVVLLS